jgi:hypothetical protein
VAQQDQRLLEFSTAQHLNMGTQQPPGKFNGKKKRKEKKQKEGRKKKERKKEKRNECIYTQRCSRRWG